jgi:dihydrofolate synthase/folylpolyglutamate synthase
LAAIAQEKAGIIKPNTPVVISERQTETTPVFKRISQQHQAPLHFAQDEYTCEWTDSVQGKLQVTKNGENVLPELTMSLKGNYQANNLGGVLKVIELLQGKGWKISPAHIATGLAQTTELTQLKGRWQILQRAPLTICDTAHNEAGLAQVMHQLSLIPTRRLHIVLGTMADKSVEKVLPLLPPEAIYYFCAPASQRAMPALELKQLANDLGLKGEAYTSVSEAYAQAQRDVHVTDVVFVGGSSFVVAEVL